MNKQQPDPKALLGNIEWREGDMPYSPAFGDYYYSRADGRAECEHVFIDGNNLKQRFEKGPSITIGELGFGTGLNLLETVRQFKLHRKEPVRLDFYSFEKFPLSQTDMQQTHKGWPELEEISQNLLDQWPEGFDGVHTIEVDQHILLHLHVGDINDTILAATFNADAWYLDGFSPAKNKDMWSLELMKEIAKRTADGGTMASYTAAGWVRRNLQEAGFEIEKRNGHAGKRDMIVGTLRA